MANESGTPPYFVGVDLGGTGMKIGVIDNRGKTIAYSTFPTFVERGPEDGVKRMGHHVFETIEQAGISRDQVVRIGLGSAGPIDIPAGKYIRPTNFPGWDFFPICTR
ncbi:MAG: ROK family protein, partial [Thermoguttaceae bacterium]|nr:ROK family protein [Thermoguttaceae bacterium]